MGSLPVGRPLKVHVTSVTSWSGHEHSYAAKAVPQPRSCWCLVPCHSPDSLVGPAGGTASAHRRANHEALPTKCHSKPESCPETREPTWGAQDSRLGFGTLLGVPTSDSQLAP